MKTPRARNLEFGEAFALRDWMAKNCDAFDGLSFAEVAQLAQDESVLERGAVTKSQIENVAKQANIRWQPPETTIGNVLLEKKVDQLLSALGTLETDVSFLRSQIELLWGAIQDIRDNA